MHRRFLFLVAILGWGCGTRVNPNICCVTADQCSALGLDETRPCNEPGQTCKNNACVAFECLSSVDCDADAPICIANICVEACATNDDCAGLDDHKLCAPDGECVACLSNSQCNGRAPICDDASRSCRSCETDGECATGVCLEAEGSCADESSLIFVSDNGQDVGTCLRNAPCKTIQFAQTLLTPTRRVIRILGGQYALGGTTIAINATIDGSNTNLVSAARPLFVVATAATLSGVRIASTSFADTVISVQAGGLLKLVSSTIDNAEVRLTTGAAEVTNVRFVNGRLDCTTGSVVVRNSVFDRSSVDPEDCMMKLLSSRLGPSRSSAPVIFSSGENLLTIENNLFVENVQGVSAMYLFGYAIGSTVRFNTFINTAANGNSSSITCFEGLDVTSNIIATNSSNPISPCTARHTLFDTAGAPAAAAGQNNTVHESALFFVNPLNDDYHLSSSSPAIGLGEPGMVTTDFDGKPRPAPIGSKPDVGAFEHP